jgi:UDP-glucose 4-epimerase
VLESIADPLPNLQANVVSLVGLLVAAAEARVDRFVFASSNAAVGDVDGPVDELRLPRPASPYGASKLAGEGYCHAFGKSHGLPAVILRFANVYGPGSLHKSSAVHKFVRASLAGTPIKIFGDGLQTRDFIYVDDVTAAVQLALGAPAAVGELFQVGTGVETSVLELLGQIEAVSGRRFQTSHVPPNAGEIRRSVCNVAKAQSLLGFRAATPLADGLRRTYRWYEEQVPTEVVTVGARRSDD